MGYRRNGREEYRPGCINTFFSFIVATAIGLTGAILVFIVLPMSLISMCRKGNEFLDRIHAEAEAEIALTKSSIQAISTALYEYFEDNGCFPTTEQGLDALIRKPALPPIPKKWTKPYLDPNDDESLAKFIDVWGNAYIYKYPSSHKGVDFDLYSRAFDGQDGPLFDDGPVDDITNWDTE